MPIKLIRVVLSNPYESWRSREVYLLSSAIAYFDSDENDNVIIEMMNGHRLLTETRFEDFFEDLMGKPFDHYEF